MTLPLRLCKAISETCLHNSCRNSTTEILCVFKSHLRSDTLLFPYIRSSYFLSSSSGKTMTTVISLPYNNICSGTIRWQGWKILDTTSQYMLISYFFAGPKMSSTYSNHQKTNVVESYLLIWQQNSSHYVEILTQLPVLICSVCTLCVSSRIRATDDDSVHNSKANKKQELASTGVN